MQVLIRLMNFNYLILSGFLFCATFIGISSWIGKSYPAVFNIEINHLVQQPDDITCGPTSVCMLLYFYNKNISVDEIKKITNTVWYSWNGRDVGMTSPSYIVSSLKYFGLHSRQKYGNLNNLKHQISHGTPCILLVRSGEWNWHYVLVCGYSENYIFYANPTTGEIEGLSTDEFYSAWSWNSDLRGRTCGQLPKYFLKGIEIYPNSYIFVE